MSQGPDVTIARFASGVDMLVDWQLPVEGDSKSNASNAQYRLNDSFQQKQGINVVNFVTPPGGAELYYFRFIRIEWKTVHL